MEMNAFSPRFWPRRAPDTSPEGAESGDMSRVEKAVNH